MKRHRTFLKITNSVYQTLKCPNTWYQLISQNKKIYKMCVTALAVFLLIGVLLWSRWPFPHFIEFVAIFIFIGGLGFWATIYFSRNMDSIIAQLSHQPAAEKANTFYFRHFAISTIYVLGPLLIVLTFGIGGCMMFGALQLTPTLIWVLAFFTVVVYLSIIGYLQYIALAIYIRDLARGSGKYKKLQKSMVDCVPAKLEWIQQLTKLSHTYRSGFFTLGAAYILAYAGFCWLPEMQANVPSAAFYILWGIIFVVIVMLFPTVSLLEYKWIKEIVEQLKVAYIKDLDAEIKIKENSAKPQSGVPYRHLVQVICATQISDSKDYPIKSAWAVCYAAIFSLFNFASAIATVLQGGPILSAFLLHIS